MKNIFKEQYSTWEHAYISLKDIIKKISKSSHMKQITWGDLEHVTNEIENKEQQLFNVNITNWEEEFGKHLCSNLTNSYGQCEFGNDL